MGEELLTGRRDRVVIDVAAIGCWIARWFVSLMVSMGRRILNDLDLVARVLARGDSVERLPCPRRLHDLHQYQLRRAKIGRPGVAVHVQFHRRYGWVRGASLYRRVPSE